MRASGCGKVVVTTDAITAAVAIATSAEPPGDSNADRPRVPQRRGEGEGVEVAGLGEDEPPVRHVADGRQRVVAYPTHVRLAGEEQGVEAHAHQHEEKGRQQAPRPAGPEATEADGTG